MVRFFKTAARSLKPSSPIRGYAASSIVFILISFFKITGKWCEEAMSALFLVSLLYYRSDQITYRNLSLHTPVHFIPETGYEDVLPEDYYPRKVQGNVERYYTLRNSACLHISCTDHLLPMDFFYNLSF